MCSMLYCGSLDYNTWVAVENLNDSFVRRNFLPNIFLPLPSPPFLPCPTENSEVGLFHAYPINKSPQQRFVRKERGEKERGGRAKNHLGGGGGVFSVAQNSLRCLEDIV